MPRQLFNDVLVVIPGITGSTLARPNGQGGLEEVWGLSAGTVTRNLLSLGRHVRELTLPDRLGDGDPQDGVVATGLIRSPMMLPGFVAIDGYSGLVGYLRERLVLDPPSAERAGNLVEFPYDWRLSNRLIAQRLKDKVVPVLDRWRTGEGRGDARLVLLCHSMGGLVARWFLERLGGNEITRTLITMGTPYSGSINALTTLVNGLSPGLGPLRLNLDEVVRSMPSVHQLLPTYDCLAQTGAPARSLDGVDLPGIRSQDLADAMAFHETLRTSVGARASYRIHALKGIAQPTAQSAYLAGSKVQPVLNYAGSDRLGDGTVPRMSSHPPEWTDGDADAEFYGQQHAVLQSDPAIQRQVYGVLTAQLGRLMGEKMLGLSLPDVVAYDAPLEISVRSEDGDPHLALLASVHDEAGKPHGSHPLRPDGDGGYHAAVSGLPPGGYSIDVTSAAPQRPVDRVRGITLVWDVAQDDV